MQFFIFVKKVSLNKFGDTEIRTTMSKTIAKGSYLHPLAMDYVAYSVTFFQQMYHFQGWAQRHTASGSKNGLVWDPNLHC